MLYFKMIASFDTRRLVRLVLRARKHFDALLVEKNGDKKTLLYDKYNGVYTLGDCEELITFVVLGYLRLFGDFTRPEKAEEIRAELLSRTALDCPTCQSGVPCHSCEELFPIESIEPLFHFRTEAGRGILFRLVGILQCREIQTVEEGMGLYLDYQAVTIKKILARMSSSRGKDHVRKVANMFAKLALEKFIESAHVQSVHQS